MRRDQRACPARERCLAAESASRSRAWYRTQRASNAAGRASRYEFMAGKLLHGNDTSMTVRATISRVVQQEDINFLLTNRIPRRWLTLLVGWLSKIEHPLIAVPAIALWRLFCDVDLRDARATHFRSLHECFTRELKAGARPIDPDPATMVSPSEIGR